MWFFRHMDKFWKEALGPKMVALHDDRQRLFVWWMANGAPNVAAAARAAGYSNVKEGAKVRGCMLMQQPAILEALNECAQKTLRSLAPLAITKAKRILEDAAHPHHGRMIEAIMDRTGHIAETRHTMTVEHSMDVKGLEELARRLAAETGVDAKRFLGTNAPVIEGEVVDGNVFGGD